MHFLQGSEARTSPSEPSPCPPWCYASDTLTLGTFTVPENPPASEPLHILFSLPGKVLCSRSRVIQSLTKCHLLTEALTSPPHPSLPRTVPALNVESLCCEPPRSPADWDSYSPWGSPYHTDLLCSSSSYDMFTSLLFCFLSPSPEYGSHKDRECVVFCPRL